VLPDGAQQRPYGPRGFDDENGYDRQAYSCAHVRHMQNKGAQVLVAAACRDAG